MNKIDYEITVDVRGMSTKKKRKAQDAFFKLGYKWFGTQAKMHFGLERDEVYAYTNALEGGDVDDHIMCAPAFRAPTHTYNQLMELAGMTDKKQLSDLNSDELRTKLAKNGGKMNKLQLQNDEIVELLRSRALKAIDVDVKVALTVDQLMAGGWFLLYPTGECSDLFQLKGLKVAAYGIWSYKYAEFYNGYVAADNDKDWLSESSTKQIHRIGNDFYWGAP